MAFDDFKVGQVCRTLNFKQYPTSRENSPFANRTVVVTGFKTYSGGGMLPTQFVVVKDLNTGEVFEIRAWNLKKVA